MTKFYRFFHTILKGFIKLFFNIRIVGKENRPKKGEGPYIICANHIAALDPVAIAVSLNHTQPHYLAKEELFKNGIARWFFYNIGMIPLNRGGSDVGALKTAIKALKDGKSIGIFPQGTRHPGKEPRDTKAKMGVGMIQSYAEADILPIYIRTKDNVSKTFRRKTIIIGKPILASEIGKQGRGSAEYERVSNFIFDKICLLGEDYERALEADKKAKSKK